MINEVPLITVVVPCYNSGDTIQRSISSVVNQTYENVEILIVDDGSSDVFTTEILRNLMMDGYKVITKETNEGLAAARNTGLLSATGDFVTFLDADDWLDPTALCKMLDKLTDSGEQAFVFSDIYFEGERHGRSNRVYRPFSQLIINKLPYCILFKRSAVAHRISYCEEMRDGLEDWDFNLSLLASNFAPIRVEEPLFHYFVRSNGMFASLTQQKYFSLWRKIRLRHSESYKVANLKRLARLEISEFGVGSIILPMLILLSSKLPIEPILNKSFNSLVRAFRSRSKLRD